MDDKAPNENSRHPLSPVSSEPNVEQGVDRKTGRSQSTSDDGSQELTEKKLEKQSSHDRFLVVFQPEDPDNPKNWGRLRRWFMSLSSSILVLNATISSSAPSGILQPVSKEFHVSMEISVLTVALFVAGYCFAPLVWAPLSEQYGRRPVFIVAFVCYIGSQIGAALSPNAGALVAFRFLGGTFAACPLTNSGGLIADIWDPDTRGKALALYCLAPIVGPCIGPVIGGYIGISRASWRWVYWVLTCFAGFCLLLILCILPETYAPVLLAKKAHKIRVDTGDERYYAAHERKHTSFADKLKYILAKPFVVLAKEPMLIAIDAYMAFVYGCIYLLFEAYPVVFQKGYHLNAGASGLMFLPLLIGGGGAMCIYLFYFEPLYQKKWEELHPDPVPPEERLRMAKWIGPLYVISFFWFGWTSYPSIPYWVPMMSGVFTGMSIIVILMSLVNYIVDAYLFVAASALASMTVVRSVAGAAFPLFADEMYTKLTPRWASTILGLVALLLTPIPFVLSRYGRILRRLSKYAPSK